MCTLKQMRIDYNQAMKDIKDKFVVFFRQDVDNGIISNGYMNDIKVLKHKIEIYKDIENVQKNDGFYIILTNFEIAKNTCGYEINEDGIGKLKAVYRGQATDRNSRIIGHLFKNRYNGSNTNFMTINLDNGINIDTMPYKNYKWFVIEYSLNGTRQDLRIQMEKAFDEVFGKPMFSPK